MSESESENEPVEVEVPKPKKKTQMSEDRRKQMLANLAKGRKTRAENLSKKRLEKEQIDLKKENENKCDYCGSAFKYKTSKIKHMKTCSQNPNYVEVEDKPVIIEEKEKMKEEKEEKVEEETPKVKEEKTKKKKKVVYKEYSSSDSSSEEEIIYKKKKRKGKGKIVFLDGTEPPQKPPVLQRTPAPAPKPQMSEEQRQALIRKKQEDERYIQLGKKQEENANRIKMLSANMVRKNRF